MTNETRQPHGSWWQTFPGILTAIAGLVTALAGLLVVLHQVGLLGNAGKQPATTPASTKLEAAPAPLAEAPAAAAPPSAEAYSVAFPKGSEVSFEAAGNETVYTVLDAVARNRNAGTISLKLSIRATNKGPYDTLMVDSQFRMLVDGVPRAPVSSYSELVPSRSAKEGEVDFDVPVTARNLVLTVHKDQDAADIPIILKKSR